MNSVTSVKEILETPRPDRLPDSAALDLEVAERQQVVTGFVEQFHGDVYRFAYRLTGDSDWAEDIVQNTFLKSFERLEQLRDQAKAKSWLLAIARTTFLGDLRKRKSWVFTDAEMDGGQVPTAEVESSLDSARLQAALMEMPEAFRVVVVMHYLQQESYRDIAEQLEIPIGTVMSRLSRAKRMLKTKLIALEKQNDQ